MRTYTQDEADLYVWRKRIEETTTNRQELKEYLIQILCANDEAASTRKANFTAYRAHLLSDAHQQPSGWDSWLADFISFFKDFLPDFITNIQFGSRLRRTLETCTPGNHKLALVTKEQLNMGYTPELEKDNVFEDVMFEEPQSAAEYLYNKLNSVYQVSQSSHMRESAFNNLLERTIALKNCLHPDLYLEFINKLFAINPNRSAQFFLNRSRIEGYCNSEAKDYYELYRLARYLVYHHYVDHDPSVRIHNAQMLLVLCSLDTKLQRRLKLNAHILEGLLSENSTQKTSDKLVTVYDGISKSLWQLINDTLSKTEKASLQAKKRLSSSHGQKTNTMRDSSDATITDNSAYSTGVWLHTANLVSNESDSLINGNPLLMHVAWQLCEQLMSDYYKHSETIDKHNVLKTLQFITSHFLGKSIDKVEDILPLMNAHRNIAVQSLIPPEIRESENLAVRLIDAAARGLNFLLDIIGVFNTESRFKNSHMDWILIRLNWNLSATDYKAARYAIVHPLCFDTPAFNQLHTLKADDFDDMEPAQLRANLQKEFKLLLEYNAQQNHVQEKEIAKTLLSNLCIFINHSQIDSENLQEAITQIKNLHIHRYITSDLNTHLSKEISNRHRKMLKSKSLEISSEQLGEKTQQNAKELLATSMRNFNSIVNEDWPDLSALEQHVTDACLSIQQIAKSNNHAEKQQAFTALKSLQAYLPDMVYANCYKLLSAQTMRVSQSPYSHVAPGHSLLNDLQLSPRPPQ